MRRLVIAALALVLFGPAGGAQENKDKPKTTPAEEFKGLVEEFQKIRQETQKKEAAAKTDVEKKAVEEEHRKKLATLAGRLLGFAQAHPNDAAAVDALVGVVNIGTEADQEKALTMLRTTAAKAADKGVQAQAAFSLASHLKRQLDDPDSKPEEAPKMSKEAEDLFERAAKLAAGATDARSQQIAKTAEKQLYVLRNFAVGKTAPDIEGADSDGKKFKLSDYRGKVVVLDFWASWCPPCMAMVPHERELVKRLEGKPFALLGVNLDSSRELLKKTEEQHKMSWRSFFDGSEGPIAEKWNVRSIPAIYVLDHKGVIRYKDVRDKAMDAAVEALLKEVPPADKK